MNGGRPHVVPTHQLIKKPAATTQVGSVISQSDLERMRGNARSLLAAEEAKRQTLRHERKTREELAAQRAERTKQGDEFRASQRKATPSEVLQTQRAAQLKDEVVRATIEQDDIAKVMNSLELQARAFAVRDRQVVIQQRANVERAVETQRERDKYAEDLRRLKEQEDLKLQAAQRERDGLKASFDAEIRRKEELRLLEEEQKLRECEAYKAEARRQMEQELALWREKQEQIKRDNLETARINEEAALKRQAIQEQERLLDERIKREAILSDARALEAELRKKQEEKERTQQFLKDQQSFQDQSHIRGEIERARENAVKEKAERQFQQQKEAERKKKEAERIEALAYEQKVREQRGMKQEREALENARELQKLKEERRKWQLEQLERAQKKTVEAHVLADDFETQMELRSKTRVQENKRRELEAVEQEKLRRKQMLEALKAEKIQKLKQANVDPKYLVALEALDIEQMMLK